MKKHIKSLRDDLNVVNESLKSTDVMLWDLRELIKADNVNQEMLKSYYAEVEKAMFYERSLIDHKKYLINELNILLRTNKIELNSDLDIINDMCNVLGK